MSRKLRNLAHLTVYLEPGGSPYELSRDIQGLGATVKERARDALREAQGKTVKVEITMELEQ